MIPDGRGTVSTEAHHNSSTWEEQQQLALAVRAGRVRWETCAVRGLSAINGATCRMFPWCGTAGLSVFRGEEGPGAGDFRINLDHLRAGYFQRDLDYQITISSTRSAWHSFSRHVRKSFSFSFFEKKLFLFLFF